MRSGLRQAARLLGAAGGKAGLGTPKNFSATERRRRAEHMRQVQKIYRWDSTHGENLSKSAI